MRRTKEKKKRKESEEGIWNCRRREFFRILQKLPQRKLRFGTKAQVCVCGVNLGLALWRKIEDSNR
ncbi:uncharacterized protein G2W53_024389 [Senna tora]|uniref:Uncharacterized protein n=1 Tax=Senna tora TaxID=362788 RepID=A0A834TCP5_9FABA|nr:uncharacterized protein G2W53_024389 [Senna tora]